MSKSKLIIENSDLQWDSRRRYRVNAVVFYSDFNWQNLSGKNSEPGVGPDWIKIPSGQNVVPDATDLIKGILRLTGDLGGTADNPTTPTAVHKTGNETIAGQKQIVNSLTTPSTFLFFNQSNALSSALTIDNSSTTQPAIKIATSSNGTTGAIISQFGSSSTGMLIEPNQNNPQSTARMLVLSNKLAVNGVVDTSTPLTVLKNNVTVASISDFGVISGSGGIFTGQITVSPATTTQDAIIGTSTSGIGITGNATTGTGVKGQTVGAGTAVFGSSTTGIGVLARSNSGIALVADSFVSNPIIASFRVANVEIASVLNTGVFTGTGLNVTGNAIAATPTASNHLVTKAYADSLVVGLLDDRGSYNASTNLFPTTGGSGTSGAILKGDLWYVSVAGTLGGTAVAVGSSFRALVDSPGQTAANWSILSSNLGYVPENVANKQNSLTVDATNLKYPTVTAVNTGLALKANDSDVLHKTLNEIKTGSLTISVSGDALTGISSTGVGVYGSSSSGIGITASSNTGIGLRVNNTTGNTSDFAQFGVNGIYNTKINYLGEFTGSKFIKIGGLATEYLKADGSVSTLTNAITGTGTTNFLSKFLGTGTIGNSQIFDNGANVGIGTTTPAVKLEVRGQSIIANTDLVIGSVGSLIQIDQGATSGNTFSRIRAYDTGGTNPTNLIFNGNGGNVGIGMNTPSFKLDVFGPDSNGIRYSGASGVQTILGCSSTTSQIGSVSNNDVDILAGSALVMKIKVNGNVGIGTASPSSLGSGYVTLETKGVNGSGIIFAQTGEANNYVYTNSTGFNIETTKEIRLVAGGLIRQTINPTTGNVLIGSPTDNGVDKLQVNGTISTSGYKAQEYGSGSLNTYYSLMPTGTTITILVNAGGSVGDTPSANLCSVNIHCVAATYGSMTALDFSTNKFYTRTINGGSWSAWVEK